ncbi:hypothetical protein N7492_000266 [Penicillium capsulatum]|uniref:Glycoside hydrolase family 3 C-terminal domain-containing protein n=1 Tax=Penicillium capsulatum TaxID=69766 RepID=A0A9W9LYU3_9EURO|nr:hypothetical protein N7492_000266 [Penicillium capsulatum]KAJ6130668.1 hypothetical protein N7512_003448 [Penicillium capsulatum]
MHETFVVSSISAALGVSASLTTGTANLPTHVDALELDHSFSPTKAAYWNGYPHPRRTSFAVSPDGRSAYVAYLDSSETDVHVKQLDPSAFEATAIPHRPWGHDYFVMTDAGGSDRLLTASIDVEMGAGSFKSQKIPELDLDKESIVLLENHNQTLPLKKSGSIAVIGPMAQGFMNVSKTLKDFLYLIIRQRRQYGDYVVYQNRYRGVTPLDGFKAAVGDEVQINYA